MGSERHTTGGPGRRPGWGARLRSVWPFAAVATAAAGALATGWIPRMALWGQALEHQTVEAYRTLAPPLDRAADPEVLRGGLLLALLGATFLFVTQSIRVWRRDTRDARQRDALQRARLLSERYRDFVDNTYEIMFRHDLEGRYEWINPQGAALLGFTPEEFSELRLEQVVHPHSLDEMRALVTRVTTGAHSAEPFECRVRTRGGDSLWWQGAVRAFRDHGGRVTVEGVARDASPERASESAQQVHARIAETLHDAASIEEGLTRLLRVLCGELTWDWGEAYLVDREYQILRAVAHSGGDPLTAPAWASPETLAKGGSFGGRVWANAESWWIPDLRERSEGWAAELTAAGGVRSALGIPIAADDEVVGVILLYSGAKNHGEGADTSFPSQVAKTVARFVKRLQLQHATRGSEARLLAILETSLDAIVSTDREGRIVEFNPAAERVFDRHRADVLGQRAADLLIPPPFRAAHDAGFAARLLPSARDERERPDRRSRGMRMEVAALRADGSEFPIELSVTPVYVGDQPVVTAFIRDITERKQLEALKDELVSTVSHELRTPLASVRGFVELMQTRDLPEAERKRFLGIVEIEVNRLGALIDDFLDLQRLEAGAQNYHFEPLDLCVLLAESLEVFEANSHGHEFETHLPDAELRVEADPDRLRQLVLNLLSNAVKYSPEGGTVGVRAVAEPDSVLFSVSDEGLGMDEATVENLFEKFFRADNKSTRKIGGTGLGLALVKQIAEAHGGSVWAESELGEGSTFFVRLPTSPERRREPS